MWLKTQIYTTGFLYVYFDVWYSKSGLYFLFTHMPLRMRTSRAQCINTAWPEVALAKVATFKKLFSWKYMEMNSCDILGYINDRCLTSNRLVTHCNCTYSNGYGVDWSFLNQDMMNSCCIVNVIIKSEARRQNLASTVNRNRKWDCGYDKWVHPKVLCVAMSSDRPSPGSPSVTWANFNSSINK